MIGDRVLYRRNTLTECWVHDITPDYTVLKPCWFSLRHKLFYVNLPEEILPFQRKIHIGQVVRLDHTNHNFMEGVVVDIGEKIRIQIPGTRVHLEYDIDSPHFMPTDKTKEIVPFDSIDLKKEQQDPYMFSDVTVDESRGKVIDFDQKSGLYLVHSWCQDKKYRWLPPSKICICQPNFYVNRKEIFVGRYTERFKSRYPDYPLLILQDMYHHHTFENIFLKKILDIQFSSYHKCAPGMWTSDAKEKMLALIEAVDQDVPYYVRQLNNMHYNKSMIEDTYRHKSFFYCKVHSVSDVVELDVFYNNNLDHPMAKKSFHFQSYIIDPIMKHITNRSFECPQVDWDKKIDIPSAKHSILYPHQVWAFKKMKQMEKKQIGNIMDTTFCGKNYNLLHGFCRSKVSYGGVLALDTGLGKTLCVIELIKYHPCKTIIVLPLSLIDQWKDEISKYYPQAYVTEYYGKRKSTEGQIVLTTYGTICNSLMTLEADRVIFDECHCIKSAFSNTALSCSKISAKKRWCVTATPGDISKMAPIMTLLNINPFWTHDMDKYLPYLIEKEPAILSTLLNKIFIVLRKHQLSSNPIKSNIVFHDISVDMCTEHRDMYNHLYLQTKEQMMMHWRENSGLRKYNKILSAYNKLHMVAMHPRSLSMGQYAKRINSKQRSIESMTKEMNNTEYERHVAQSMQSMDDQACCICLEPFDRPTITSCRHIFCYDCICSSLKHKKTCPQCRQSINKSSLTELVHEMDMVEKEDTYVFNDHGIQKELPKSIHALYNKEIVSNKIRWIKNKIKDHPDQSFVIFSQFNTSLNYLKMHFDSVGMIDGKKTRAQRKKDIEKFRQKQLKVFLLSTKTSAVGLTLTASCHLIFVEPLLDKDVFAQAIGRLHRIGQDKNVSVYTLYSKNTIEDQERVKNFMKSPSCHLKKSKLEYFISI